ncbi:nicotinate (nicotinamide) nucleotide adenylyltransferase [Pseudobacteriovorax antillogorgiicola]|uniref:Probable nicotinate-nucleotide adenylyltransferase n=1 Tax=Pseudobacteriovorax antillogorgiicola TaxID=1513793 RepID=A0A1Y6CJQ2_9BACT|nr:nicotinate (nicotinamide) nucleotide adenylyltransferase [Pseudobacteriovorax antillogorgiicola]TCS46707.1 nicotinate-nucleotide adenylyltransferase [Pseudobacteriovorax antillogorgiicola]SMF66965.1 nicotinate-nucleotide adenylyltransferase [Pseudobacteriovorax antillogorgiicola]
MDEIPWVLYGGTFDPPHLGHLAVLRQAINVVKPARCVVVPAYVPPVSEAKVKSPTASYRDRLTMTNAMFGSRVIGSNVEVSDIESHLPQPSYTVNTLQHFDREWGVGGALLIGADQWQSFAGWYQAKQILSMWSILIVGRDGLDLRDLSVNIAENLELKLHWDGQRGRWDSGTQVVILPEVSDAASRAFRSKPEGNAEHIDPAVIKIIKDKRLYQ